MRNIVITILLALAASVSLFAQTSGTCGTNLTWTYDETTRVLTISGSGDMDNYMENHTYDMPWLNYQTSIASIVFPDSITSIGNNAFYLASNLTSVTIPDGVTRVGNRAFYGCSKLSTVLIPNSVTSIGSGAFTGCCFTSFTIPNSVTSIGSTAFAYCANLSTINIPSGITSINSSMFAYCSALDSITIPEGVTSIKNEAFMMCTSLKSINLPNSLKSIGFEAFMLCSGLTSITLPDSLTNIGTGAFCYSGLTSVDIPNGLTSIVRQAFSVCSQLTSVTIPNSVTSIGSGAFSATHLTSITIPGSVTVISDGAFYDCTYLNYITCLAPQPPSLDQTGFLNVNKATPLLVLNSSLQLYKTADVWKDFTRIIAIPDNKCGINLTWMVQDSVLTISGTGAMFNYSHPDSVPWNPQYGNSITNVIIENGATSIGDKAFYGCSVLDSIIIPTSLTTIGKEAFACSGLTSITIPNSVTSIGTSAFAGSGLTSFSLPLSITAIGDSICYSCANLSSVTLHNGVTSIGDWAFAYCTILDTITCFAVVPPAVEDFTFEEVPTSAKLFVPAGSVAAYQADPIWGRFFIQPIEATDLLNVENDNSLNGSVRDLLANPAIKVYNLQGYDVSANRNDLPAGVYILRLNNQAAKVTIR